MKLLEWCKDGGKDSHVDGFFFIEIKWLFSIVLLKFNPGSREAFHSHAFNCLSWILKGFVIEYFLDKFRLTRFHWASIFPFFTWRDDFHKVYSPDTTWILSFRGPWKATWKEYLPAEDREITLTHGRHEVYA